jgi:hypothetical protein
VHRSRSRANYAKKGLSAVKTWPGFTSPAPLAHGPACAADTGHWGWASACRGLIHNAEWVGLGHEQEPSRNHRRSHRRHRISGLDRELLARILLQLHRCAHRRIVRSRRSHRSIAVSRWRDPATAKETTADGYTYRPVKGADMDGDERRHDRPPFSCLHGPQLRCWAGLGPARHGSRAVVAPNVALKDSCRMFRFMFCE